MARYYNNSVYRWVQTAIHEITYDKGNIRMLIEVPVIEEHVVAQLDREFGDNRRKFNNHEHWWRLMGGFVVRMWPAKNNTYSFSVFSDC